MLSDSQKIILSIIGLTITGAICGIITPNLVMMYPSLYFLQIMTSIQFVLVFSFFYLLVMRGKIVFPKEHKKVIFLSALFNSFVSILMIYSGNPKRTPVLMQSILMGSIILPTFILRKIIIKKVTTYNYYYIMLSIILLIISLALSVIPLFEDMSWKSFGWTLMYASGVVCMSIYNILQEKYLTDSRDGSIQNKLMLMFYVRILQFLILLTCFWLEYIIGYNGQANPFVLIYDSFVILFHEPTAAILLEVFIVSYVGLYWISVYLNSISTNYNMISSTITNPVVTIFFTIFSELNPGIKFPLYITIPCLLLSITSTICWIRGEKKTGYERIN